jgi:small subunit ribosomal protein S20
MPQHKSCKKRMITSAKQEARNKAGKSALRRALRVYREQTDGDREAAYKQLQSLLDKAVNKGLISRNKAARLKSRQTPAPAA